MNVEFKKIDHVITEQFLAEKKLLEECKATDYRLKNPYIRLNPYLIAPLTALVHFKTEQAESVTVIVKGKDKNADIHFSFPEDTQHYLPVLGLYAAHDNQVEITLGNGEKKLLSIKTEPLPELVRTPAKISTTAEYMGQNVMLLSPATPGMTTAYDYRGDVRWYCTLNLAFDIKRLKNGRLLLGNHRLHMPPYHTTGLFEMGMIGKIYNEYRLPGGCHHDQFEMEDGNLLILTQEAGSNTVEDTCVLVDRKTGNIIKTWDYKKVLPQNVGGSGSQDEHDWFHNNSVWYDKKTNSLTLSGRHQDAVINIDYDTGKLNWIIGDPEGWPQEMVDKYFFRPVGDLDNFDWQYEQHAAVVLPDGDILCFDNGHWRAKVKEKYVPAEKNFSRGVRYRIDTKKMEIEQVWQYGKERGAEFFSTYICNVEYYGEGHYMVHSGGIGTYQGKTCDLPPALYTGKEYDQSALKLRSVTVEIMNDEVVYELELTKSNFYRAEKLPLYCQEDVLSFGQGKLLGTLGVTEKFLTMPEVTDGGMAPAHFDLKIAQEEDRLVMKGIFEKGQLVMLLLEGDEQLAYFIPTTRRPFLAMCVGTFQEYDDRAVEFPISTEGIAGKYRLSLIVDDKKYQTGIEISL